MIATADSNWDTIYTNDNFMARFGARILTPVSEWGDLDISDYYPSAISTYTASDGVLLAGGSGSVVLTFGIETGQTVAEYYEVVLHRVSGGSTIPERAFTITGPSLTIERSVLAAATEYIFEIRAFRGAPGARDADFTRYSPAQTSAVMWTHSFITP